MAIATSAVVAYAKQRADMETGGVVSAAAEWLQLVNYAYLDLWDLLAQHQQDHFVSTSTFTLAGGAGAGSQQAAPTDLGEIRLMEFQTGDVTQWAPVEPFSLTERGTPDGRRFRLMGATIYILPELSSAGNYRLWYTPVAATLRTTPDDPIDARLERWWEYAGLGAAKRALGKEESSVRDIDDEMQAIAARIAKMAVKRQGSPRTTATRFGASRLSWVNGRQQWLP